jgi:hypothetical protein
MFLDYLINVALVGASYWVSALIIFVFGFVYRAKIGKDIWAGVKGGALVISIWGLVAGMTSSANTYKNTVDYNRYQDQTMIEQRRENQPTLTVEDRTRQPLSEAELQERAVDMRDRIELNPVN